MTEGIEQIQNLSQPAADSKSDVLHLQPLTYTL